MIIIQTWPSYLCSSAEAQHNWERSDNLICYEDGGKKGQSLSFIKRINKTAGTHKESHSWRQTESHCSINQRRTKRFNDSPRPKLFLLRSLHLHTEHNLTSSPSGLISDFMELFVPACRQFPELLLFTGLLTRGQRMCYILGAVLCSFENSNSQKSFEFFLLLSKIPSLLSLISILLGALSSDILLYYFKPPNF